MKKCYLSESANPFDNLAIEHDLMMSHRDGEKSLFLYRNEPSVIIGQFQNPYLECDLEYLDRSGIHFVRRTSGGGTVVHDLGNLNFAFIEDEDKQDRCENLKVIKQGLGDLGIAVKINERSDLVTEDNLKVSGSAFRVKNGASLHHGTLLLNSDLPRLKRALQVENKGIVSKGVDSVRSRVTNLDPEKSVDVEKALQNCFASNVPAEKICVQNTQQLEKFKEWGWLFGRTPSFSQEMLFSCGERDFSLSLLARKGTVQSVRLILGKETIEIEALKGLNYGRKFLEGKVPANFEFNGIKSSQLETWLSQLF